MRLNLYTQQHSALNTLFILFKMTKKNSLSFLLRQQDAKVQALRKSWLNAKVKNGPCERDVGTSTSKEWHPTPVS